MKKLLLAFLSIPLTLAISTGHANTFTYYVTFNNPNIITPISQEASASYGTTLSCTGNCVVLPFEGSVTYKITDDNYAGTLGILFQYPTKDSKCPLDIGRSMLSYTLNPMDSPDNSSFTINIGDQPPPATYGVLEEAFECDG